VVNVIDDIHKRCGEVLLWLRIDYEVYIKSSAASSARYASRRVIARPRCQVMLLAVRSRRSLLCVRHKVEVVAPAAEPVGDGGTPPWLPP
jgi:hypothetical protein